MKDLKQTYTLHYHLREPYPHKEDIVCTLKWSDRRSYGISIEATGEVMLHLPLSGSERDAARMAEEKRGWIIEKVLMQRQRLEEAQKKEAQRDKCYTPEQRSALEKRYREAAKEYFPKRAAYYAYLLGVSYDRIRIAGQKTRWGSCSSNKTLSFNWKLMLAPPKVLDYVVVHEVCHLREMNHSPRFWALVESLMPDYKQQRKWLKDNGYTLEL